MCLLGDFTGLFAPARGGQGNKGFPVYGCNIYSVRKRSKNNNQSQEQRQVEIECSALHTTTKSRFRVLSLLVPYGKLS
jgi:hypothetical protein